MKPVFVSDFSLIGVLTYQELNLHYFSFALTIFKRK